MRGTAALFTAKNVLKHFHHPSGGGGGCGCVKGILATSTPTKQDNHKTGEDKAGMSERVEVEPIVAFSRPPPLPPVFGPLVALSLLEAWTSRDNNDG